MHLMLIIDPVMVRLVPRVGCRRGASTWSWSERGGGATLAPDAIFDVPSPTHPHAKKKTAKLEVTLTTRYPGRVGRSRRTRPSWIRTHYGSAWLTSRRSDAQSEMPKDSLRLYGSAPHVHHKVVLEGLNQLEALGISLVSGRLKWRAGIGGH